MEIDSTDDNDAQAWGYHEETQLRPDEILFMIGYSILDLTENGNV